MILILLEIFLAPRQIYVWFTCYRISIWMNLKSKSHYYTKIFLNSDNHCKLDWIFLQNLYVAKMSKKNSVTFFYSFCFRNDARVDDYKLNDQKASRIKSNLRTSKLFVFYRWFPLLIVLEHYRLVDFLWGFEYIEK